MSEFEKAIPVILKHEGGYVNDPVDPGGATKYGVSLRFLKQVEDYDIDDDGEITVNDIKAMTLEDAMRIYEAEWWDKYDYSAIDSQDIATKVFDMSVNMGPNRAHKLTQQACNHLGARLAVDGVLGPKSREAINSQCSKTLLTKIRNQAADFYLGLIAKKPAFKKYRKGWLKRAYS